MNTLTSATSMPRRAAVYLRISRDLTGEGLAIDRQRELCHGILKQKGWEIADEYVDDSISAYDRRKHRPGYERLLEDVRAGKVDAVVCYDLDRLTRQPRQLEDWVDAAEQGRIYIATANGDTDLTTDHGRLVARIRADVARAESERKGARQKVAAAQRAKLGRPPLGVRLTGYTSRGEVIEDEAEIVRFIYREFLAHESLRGIVRKLQEQDIQPRNRSKKWNPTTVYGILRNPRYAGHGVYMGEILRDKGEWEPLVSPADWDTVQARLNDPRRKTNKTGTDRKYLGSGLYYCDECGRRMTAISRYYCPPCGMSRSMKQVDDYVRAVIAAYLDSQKAHFTASARDDERARELDERATALRARIEGFRADYMAELIDARTLKEATEKATAELQQVDRERVRISHGSTVADLMESPEPGETFKGLALMPQRAVIEALANVRLKRGARGQKTFNPESVVLEWKA